MADQLECALDLMRRLPPADVEENLGYLIDLQPDLIEDLLSAVDQPLKIANDSKSGREYLLCDYNRDGDSYRSPWSNAYDPPLEDAAYPSDDLRKLEITMNEAFNHYRDQYFEGGVSSVYLWDLDGEDFAGCVLIKKLGDQATRAAVKGSWDSIHVFEVQMDGKKAHYQLTTTVMLSMVTFTKAGEVNLSGSITRQAEQDVEVTSDKTPHVVNLGRMVEDMENRLRNTLDEIYFGKTRDIVNLIRVATGSTEKKRRQDLSGKVAMGVSGGSS